ncbi:MAG: hypothetical protein OEM02_11320 [Desulfobulbaceae bacterium]|nr:hypothetical protein [Desulfobulbaceae bacterium]
MKKNFAIFILLALLIATNIHHLKPLYPIAVEKLPARISCKILTDLTEGTNPEIVQDALFRLGSFPSCNADSKIIEKLGHHDANVRHNALNALNHLGKSSLVVKETAQIINDQCEEIFVQDSAIDLIKKVESESDKTKAITALESFIEHTKYENYISEVERIISELKSN